MKTISIKSLSLTVVICMMLALASCGINSNSDMTTAPTSSVPAPSLTPTTEPSPYEIEIEVTEEQILKYYDYFAYTAPGFVQIPYFTEGGFSDYSFDSVSELPDGGLIIYALVNLSYNDLFKRDEDGYSFWETEAVIREIQRGFSREVTDFESSGLVYEIPEEGILKATGWDTGDGLHVKLLQLTKGQDGTYTALFDFYGVLDYLMEVGSFDIKGEILKDNSEILNSKYCQKFEKTVTFIEKNDEDGMYLQFVSLK